MKRITHRTRGFTLVEMLVVIAIISTLMGLALASIQVARRFSDKKATAGDILLLVQAINNYQAQYGDYPPSSLSALKVKGNGVNEGNECLVLCLSGRKKGGPFHEAFKEDRLSNLDNDALSGKDFQAVKKALDLPQDVAQLYEYTDLWGNPFVYIHNRDYSAKKIQYTDNEGKPVTVQAARSAKLGSPQSATTYQIWSFGPNRINENGDGDDIASWQ